MENLQLNNGSTNRVLDAILFQAEQEGKYRAGNPAAQRNDPESLRLRRDQYQAIRQAYRRRPGLSRMEKDTLVYVRKKIRALNAQLAPNALNWLRYSRVVQWLVNRVMGRSDLMKTNERQVRAVEGQSINSENVKQLQAMVLAAGFTVNLEGPLKRMVAHQVPSFHLRYNEPQYGQTEFVLHFRKHPGSDAYYFEKFEATQRQSPENAVRGIASAQSQSFSRMDETTWSVREATNLVHGASVGKMQQGREYWTVLDQQGNRYQQTFDLAAHLARYAIKELETPASRDTVLAALRSGNTKEVTLQHPDGQTEKVNVRADVQREGLVFTNKQGETVHPDYRIGVNATTERLMVKAQEKQTPNIRQGAHI